MEKVTFKESPDIKDISDTLFREQKTFLESKLPFADIQHVGGTSVPGLLTKGDLDINIRVSTQYFESTVDILKRIYDINQPENWSGTYASFKDDVSYTLPLGVQVTVIDGSEDFFIKHRDTLRRSPKLVEEFNTLKEKYQGADMDTYREAKHQFLKEHDLLL